MDVNCQRRLLTIARSLTEVDGVASEGPTKSHQRRGVALDDALLGLLTRRRADQEAYATVVGATLVTDPFILSQIGFETAADLIAHGAWYFDADALDASWNVLGRTSQVTVS